MLLFKVNTDNYLEASVIDFLGDFVSGLTVTYELRKSSDGSLVASGTMPQDNNTYKILANISAIGQYRATYFTPSGYENGLEKILVSERDFNDLSEILQKICEILGLSQSNFRMTNQTYSAEGCLLTALITTYPTATDTENQTNPIAQYNVTATYDPTGKLIDYKVVKV